jgi:hypothetical protein
MVGISLGRQDGGVRPIWRGLRLLRRSEKRGSQQDIDAAVQRIDDMPPYQRYFLAQVILQSAVLAGSSPVELAVPVARAAVRWQGVQTGAALGSLLAFLSTQAYLIANRRLLISEALSDDASVGDRPFDRWMSKALFAGAVVLPAAGGLLPGTVIMRTRSPLWGLALWFLVRLAAAFAMAVDASHVKKRHQAEETTSIAADEA